MNVDNPFDRKLDINRDKIPNDILYALVDVNDTMVMCWASAKSVFEDKATPEIAIAMYDRIVKKIAENESSA